MHILFIRTNSHSLSYRSFASQMPDESAAHARDRADLDAFLAHLHTRRDLVDFPPDYGELVTQARRGVC